MGIVEKWRQRVDNLKHEKHEDFKCEGAKEEKFIECIRENGPIKTERDCIEVHLRFQKTVIEKFRHAKEEHDNFDMVCLNATCFEAIRVQFAAKSQTVEKNSEEWKFLCDALSKIQAAKDRGASIDQIIDQDMSIVLQECLKPCIDEIKGQLRAVKDSIYNGLDVAKVQYIFLLAMQEQVIAGKPILFEEAFDKYELYLEKNMDQYVDSIIPNEVSLGYTVKLKNGSSIVLPDIDGSTERDLGQRFLAMIS